MKASTTLALVCAAVFAPVAVAEIQIRKDDVGRYYVSSAEDSPSPSGTAWMGADQTGTRPHITRFSGEWDRDFDDCFPALRGLIDKLTAGIDDRIYTGYFAICGGQHPIKLHGSFLLEAMHGEDHAVVSDYLTTQQDSEWDGMKFHFDEALGVTTTIWFEAANVYPDDQGLSHHDTIQRSNYRQDYRSVQYYDAFFRKRVAFGLGGRDLSNLPVLLGALMTPDEAATFVEYTLPFANLLTAVSDAKLILKEGGTTEFFGRAPSMAIFDCRALSNKKCELPSP